jgi:hypothetical protein
MPVAYLQQLLRLQLHLEQRGRRIDAERAAVDDQLRLDCGDDRHSTARGVTPHDVEALKRQRCRAAHRKRPIRVWPDRCINAPPPSKPESSTLPDSHIDAPRNRAHQQPN